MLLHPYQVHIRPTEHISGKLLLSHELSIHIHWLHLMLDQYRLCSTFGWQNIFLTKQYLISNILHILIEAFWCHIIHIEVHICPTEHISDPRDLVHELSIHTHWLTMMLLLPYMSSCLTFSRYFWHISPQSWTFYIYSLTPDYTSAIEYWIFDLMDIFLVKEYSILNFL